MKTKPSNLFFVFAVGFAIGVNFVIVVAMSHHGIGRVYYTAIQECQEAHKNVRCRIVAIPQEIGK